MSIIGGGGAKRPPKLGQGFSSLHHTTIRMLSLNKQHVLPPDSFKNAIEKLVEDMDVTVDPRKDQLNQIIQNYNKLYKAFKEYDDEEKLVSRIERNAQIRNTLFRFLSTVAIGMAVIGVYALAHYLGVTMPLLPIRI